MNTPETPSTEEGTGSYSLDGWYYQRDASVFAAIELLLVQRVSKTLFLEPASQEDMEAEIEVPNVTSSAVLEHESLVVQAKLWRSGPWTPAKLKTMVEHGTKRPSAITRLLADPKVRYVLITNADANRELQALKIEDLLEKTECTALPAKVFPSDLVDVAAQRFGILGQHSAKRLEERIQLYLMHPLCVPIAKQKDCLERLRAEALSRILTGTVWTRQELEALVREYEGSIASDRQDEFVQPGNWRYMLEKLNRHHAIVLTGPSGTGKTTTAKALAAHLKSALPALRIVDVERGPTEIRQNLSAGPAVFHVVDPWGRYEVTDERNAWSGDLKDFILDASPDRVFIVTTRTDVLSAAMGEVDFLKDRQVELSADNYGPRQLSRIYLLHLARLTSGTLRTAAHTARADVLKLLRTPFEIVRFFQHLKGGPSSGDTSEHAFVARVLAATQHDSIELELAQLIHARDAYAWAAVLWALLTTNNDVSREDLPALRRRLTALDSDFRKNSLEELINVLVAGGNLLQHGSRLTFAHPRVEQGFVVAMRKRREQTESALVALIRVLSQMDGELSSRWIANAARVCDAAKQESPSWAPIEADVQQALDIWLQTALMSDAAAFGPQMELAASVGSTQCHAAELARWLRIRASEEDNEHPFMGMHWKLPQRSDAWYASMYADERTRPLCAIFIRRELTQIYRGHRGYPQKMAQQIDRLADNLDGDWYAAAVDAIPKGYEAGTSVVAFGAMRYPNARETLLAATLDFLTPLRQSELPVTHSWDYHDGYLDGDDDYYEPDDAGSGAEEIVEAYLLITREDGDWQTLLGHPRRSEILEDWMSLLSNETLSFTDDELLAIASAAVGTQHEQTTWSRLRHRWTTVLEPLLLERLLEIPQSEELRETLARIARDTLAPQLAAAVTSLIERGDNMRAMELAFEAYPKDAHWKGKKSALRNYRRFAALLPDSFRELVLAFTPVGITRRTRLAREPLALAHALKTSSRSYLRAWSAWMMTINGKIDASALCNLLDECEDPDDGVMALRCAVEIQAWDIVWRAVDHARADVRQFAFESLVLHHDGVIPMELFRLARDRGSRVRRAIVDAIAGNPKVETVPLLIELCADRFSAEQYGHGDYPSFPIAWRAAKALHEVTRIPDEFFEALRVCALTTPDLDVRDKMFDTLGEKCGAEGPRILASIIVKTPKGDAGRGAAKALLASSSAEIGTMECPALRWFETSNLSISIFSAACVGRLSPEAQILSLCTSLSASSTHRALLISIAIGTEVRDGSLAEHVIGFLPPSHPARAVIDVIHERQSPLAHDALDDLGDVRVANALARIFDTVIQKRPKAAMS